MAKRIEGITIEIDGETKKLSSALKDVNSQIRSVGSQLKDVERLLKLDPKNTELLSQKQALLKSAIEETTNKLKSLREAQSQMGDTSKFTEEQKEAYRGLQREIISTEQDLKKYNQELKETDKASKSVDMSKVADDLKKVGEISVEVAKKVAEVSLAIGGALAGLVAKSVKSYGELEQSIGGVETLFGANADKVIANAKKAYETAGVSANEYMEGVTSFSASLLQSLGGDTAKAADVADMAFRDMSDNANKFGTDMSSIQAAYQGFAKQNYTMLDNLKLGYGGTKTEMERLLKDAEKFSGVKYDISNLSDVYNAIHVIQEELGVTGTTAEEASKTIQGSAGAMKSAFANFLSGAGGIEDVIKTVTTFAENVSNAVIEMAPKLMEGIAQLFETLLPQAIDLIVQLAPQLIDSAFTLMQKVVDAIINNVNPIINLAMKLISNIVKFILNNLPTILDAGIKILLELIKGITEALPELIPMMIKVLMDMVNILLDNIDLIIEAGIQLLVALTEGIMNALPELISRLPEIIIKICNTLINLTPQLLSAVLRIIMALAEGMVKYSVEMVSRIPQIIKSMVNALKQGVTDFLNIGVNFAKGIWSGISSSLSWIKDKIKGWVGDVTKFIKKLFGIHSPSKLMKEEIGENLGLGIAEGILNTQEDVDAAMSQLSSGIEASVNPTINPTANTNPLIIQIENFNNNRESDIQSLAQELELYRKNSALVRGEQ